MFENDAPDGLTVRAPQDRVIQDGVPVDTAALAANPFERKSSFQSVLRAAGPRAWGAAALMVGVVMLGWHLRPAAPVDETSQSSLESIAHLTATDPRALRQQIVSELRAAGADASGYEQLGINGIDADLSRPITPSVRAVLEKHRIPVPANGVLRIEMSTAH